MVHSALFALLSIPSNDIVSSGRTCGTQQAGTRAVSRSRLGRVPAERSKAAGCISHLPVAKDVITADRSRPTRTQSVRLQIAAEPQKPAPPSTNPHCRCERGSQMLPSSEVHLVACHPQAPRGPLERPTIQPVRAQSRGAIAYRGLAADSFHLPMTPRCPRSRAQRGGKFLA